MLKLLWAPGTSRGKDTLTGSPAASQVAQDSPLQVFTLKVLHPGKPSIPGKPGRPVTLHLHTHACVHTHSVSLCLLGPEGMLFAPCVWQSLYLGKEPFQRQFTDFLLGTQTHAHPWVEQGDPRALRLPRSPPSAVAHAPSHLFHPPATA